MRGMTCVACKAQLDKLSPSALAPALTTQHYYMAALGLW